MLDFQAIIYWVEYKVRLGQAKSEFECKMPKLTHSTRALKYIPNFL